MHAVLIFAGGRRVDAFLLSASSDRLRVAIPGNADTVELQLVEGRWTSDRGLSVEIGALIADRETVIERFLPQYRTFTAS